MSRRGWPTLVAAIVLAVGLAAPSSAAEFIGPKHLADRDDAQIHGTITPPGADTRHATTEIAAYDDLVQAYPSLTADRLGDFFKLRRFGPVEDVERSYQPRAGVTVVRDARWGEPKIFGATDEDMAFGAGYVGAEDRLAIMELLRALGRAEAFQLLATAPAWLADAEMARLYGYTEEELQAQVDRLPKVYGQAGADVVRILQSYVDGVNEYIALGARGEVPLPAGLSDLGLTSPTPWKTTDVVAAVSTVRALFGAGGGAELNDAATLAGLIRDYGGADGRRIYEDFRNRQNLDGPVHTVKRFPYDQRNEAAIDPASNPLGFTSGDPGLLAGPGAAKVAAQLSALAGKARIRRERLKLSTPLGAVDLSHPGSTSNHLVVGRSRSATGRPILLGGPQAGYFSPEILMDEELHSPTIHARGGSFPGLNALIVLGRTQDYAWTPTAGGSDMIDTYAEKLCSPLGVPASENSRYYEFEGKCVEMDRQTLRSAADAPPAIRDQVPDIIVERTVHGPVLARGRIGDTPVAIATKRSSYGKELDAAVSILKMNRNEARTGQDFVSIFRESHNLSTNWSYANDHEIAYVHGGLYPRRPANVDLDLPVWGTGQWEWKKGADGQDEFLGREEVPYEVAPKRDYFVSWNNRPAPGWGASDAQWGWSSIYRAKMLEDAILAEPKGTITPTRLVQMMEKAGLTDIRGRYVAPLALRVLEHAPNVGERESKMIALLREWVADGALRRDGNKDGTYDRAAAVAIMDAWWEPLIRAVFDPEVGDAARIPLPFDNAPGMGGSAYQDGFYGYLWTDLSMALGDRVKSPTSRLYCGGSATAAGNLDECAKRVLASLTAAGDALAGQQGADPSGWKADAEAERIRFLPAAALSMQWVNRPTTQQLAMFGRLGRNPPDSKTACLARRRFASIGARPQGRGLRLRIRPLRKAKVTVVLVRVARGRRIVGGTVVKRFRPTLRDFTFRPRGKRLSDGWYLARFSGRGRDGVRETRRVTLRVLRGRFHRAYTVERNRSCGQLTRYSVGSPVFGGTRGRPLKASFVLVERARVSIELRRAGRLVRRVAARTFAPGRHTHVFRAAGLKRGDHRVYLRVHGTPGFRIQLRARRI